VVSIDRIITRLENIYFVYIEITYRNLFNDFISGSILHISLFCDTNHKNILVEGMTSPNSSLLHL